MYILVSGQASVEWHERESYRDSSGDTKYRNVTYSSHEQYLNSQTVLFGEIGGPTIQFPSGSHTYNFACALPESLPGTMRSSEAEIKYKVKVVMDVPWSMDPSESVHFVVRNHIDLNQNLSLKFPVQMEEQNSFCLFSCGPSEATVSVSVPLGGYAPHTDIPILCTIDNKTGVEFQGATFSLQRILTATAISPHRSDRVHKNVEAKSEYALADDTRNTVTKFTGILKVPLCPVTCNFAAYIRTNYVVKVEFSVVGCHSDVTVRLPIQIGSIPIGATVAVPVSPSSVPLAPLPDTLIPAPSAPPTEKLDGLPAKEDPPPSYDQATLTATAPVLEQGNIPEKGNEIGWNLK